MFGSDLGKAQKLFQHVIYAALPEEKVQHGGCETESDADTEFSDSSGDELSDDFAHTIYMIP